MPRSISFQAQRLLITIQTWDDSKRYLTDAAKGSDDLIMMVTKEDLKQGAGRKL